MNNKKHIIIALLIGIFLGTTLTVSAGTVIQAYRNDEIKIKLNDKLQTFRDETTKEVEHPITYKDRTYLPLRSLATLLGFEVDYDEKEKLVIINLRDEVTVEQEELNTSEDENIPVSENEEDISESTIDKEYEPVTTKPTEGLIDQSVKTEIIKRPPDAEIPPQPKTEFEIK